MFHLPHQHPLDKFRRCMLHNPPRYRCRETRIGWFAPSVSSVKETNLSPSHPNPNNGVGQSALVSVLCCDRISYFSLISKDSFNLDTGTVILHIAMDTVVARNLNASLTSYQTCVYVVAYNMKSGGTEILIIILIITVFIMLIVFCLVAQCP